MLTLIGAAAVFFLAILFVRPRGTREWAITLAVLAVTITGLIVAWSLSPSLLSLWHGIILSAVLLYFSASDLLRMHANPLPALSVIPLMLLGVHEHGKDALFSTLACLGIGVLAFLLSGWRPSRPRSFSPSLGELDVIVMLLSGPSGWAGVYGVLTGMVLGGVVGLALLFAKRSIDSAFPYVPPLSIGIWLGYLRSLM